MTHLYGGKTITELEALANAATEGPWQVNTQEKAVIEWGKRTAGEYAVLLPDEDYGNQSNDARFIAASRTAIPALIARIRELEARNAQHVVSYDEVARENVALREALELILPMAKGYADAHKVGLNAQYIEHAEQVLSTPAPKDGMRELARELAEAAAGLTFCGYPAHGSGFVEIVEEKQPGKFRAALAKARAAGLLP